MNRTLSIAVAGFALLALVSAPAGAGDPARAEGGYDLAARLRVLGLAPQGEALRRGPYDVVYVVDGRGRTLRVVADEEAGEIISIVPVQGASLSHVRPHIIHVPQASGTERAVNAPPPSPAPAAAPARDPLTPVYPTPRFNTPDKKGF